jgi:hypothetical protein
MKLQESIKLIILGCLAMIFAVQTAYSFDVTVISTDPAPLVAGDYGDITLRITNPFEETRKNVEVSIPSTKDFKFLESDTLFLQEVYGKESITRTFRVFFSEDLPQGTITLPIEIRYDSLFTKEEIELYISNTLSNPEFFIGEISTTPSELLPDTNDNQLTITLQNLGDKDAELVSGIITTDETKIKASNSYSLQDSVSKIEAGNQKELTFTIDVEPSTYGEIPATLQLHYRAKDSVGNTYKTFNEKIPFTINIANAPDLVITNVEQLTPFTIGSSENILRLTIKNQGTKKAKEVRVRAVPDSSYPFSFEEFTQYTASSLDIGEETTVDFTIEVLSKADARDYPTTVLLESLVGESRYTQESDVTITTTGEEPKSTIGIGNSVIGIVFFFAILIGVMQFRKRKHSKK